MKKIHIIFIILLYICVSYPVSSDAKLPKFFTSGLKNRIKDLKEKAAEKKNKEDIEQFVNESGAESGTDPITALSIEYPELAAQLNQMMESDPVYTQKVLQTIISNSSMAENLNLFFKKYPSFKTYPFAENELEWNEFKTNKASASITPDGLLQLKNDNKENKDNQDNEYSSLIYSYTDLPLNVQGDFAISTQMLLPKYEKGHPYAILINLEDKFNCGIISFDCETVRYLQLKDGKIVSEQSVLINGKKSKNAFVNVMIEKTGGKVMVSVNNDPCLKIRKIDYLHTGFGFGAYPRSSFKVLSLGCGMGDDESDN